MRTICILLALILGALPAAAEHAPARTYALVVKDVQNPYMRKMYEGFVAGCRELGVEPLLSGADSTDPSAQAGIIDGLVEMGVSGLAVAANDEAGVSGPLKGALAAGIRVVSVDSAVDVDCRQTHIQQADPLLLGRALLQAAHRMVGGEGEIAILSTTPDMPNQSTWVRLLLEEFDGHPETYGNMRIAEIAYGNDEAVKSTQETGRLLDTYPGLKLIIAPTCVGMAAAANEIERRGSNVLITGLGLPSELEPHIQSGICPWMYLWNPIDTGYLAAYALDALERRRISGAVDETFSAGRLGEKIVTESLDGGTEIVVGNPYKFDSGNILVWKNAF